MSVTKTANVNARIQQSIKTDAEAILTRMGIPRSVAIDMFYRQIILHNGIPFPLTIPREVPIRDQMSEAQFNKMMATGLEQAKVDDAYDVDEVFEEDEDDIDYEFAELEAREFKHILKLARKYNKL